MKKARKIKRGDKGILGYQMVTVVQGETENGNIRVEYYSPTEGSTVKQWVDKDRLEVYTTH